MRYVKQDTIYTIQEVRKALPNVSIPEGADLLSLGYVFLVETPQPTMDGFYAVEGAPKDNKQTWTLVPLEVQVPSAISPLQAKLQLLEMGLLDEVEDIITLDRKAYIYWTNAQNFYRQDAILLDMATALGLSEEQLNTMFIEASKL